MLNVLKPWESLAEQMKLNKWVPDKEDNTYTLTALTIQMSSQQVVNEESDWLIMAHLEINGKWFESTI